MGICLFHGRKLESVIYARDKFYRENQHRTQKEDMNWRNSKIHTYYDSMEAMTNLSFLSIRMGKHLIDKIPNNKNSVCRWTRAKFTINLIRGEKSY